jgi:hypothetical protein
MTLTRFQSLMQEINPLLHIRQRGKGDVVGLYLGHEYLVRMSKGEVPLNGYRHKRFNPYTLQYEVGNIAKRGRMTLTRILEARGVIKGPRDRAKLIWGI